MNSLFNADEGGASALSCNTVCHSLKPPARSPLSLPRVWNYAAFAGLMDFICFAARLKCYYEGGVGLQNTLNHAGPKKRSSGMCMPGESDSDDDEDEEEEEEDGADGGHLHHDVYDDRDDADDDGDGNLEEGPAKEEQGRQEQKEEGGSDAVGFDGGESNADWGGAAAGLVASDSVTTAPRGMVGHLKEAGIVVARVEEEASAASTAPAPAYATGLASSASAGPRVEVPSQKPHVSALDVISVSSVSAALSAAVKAVSTSGKEVEEAKPSHQRAPTE